ncbi:hypothetical protein NSA24_10075 [Clostridioides mangenotii]|uniref:hypothetical protein n=1 Tax=Metaclostridioides mangenotii TaxID=1540 RepID=UPI00214A5987|nr:hypothetical protein [Clostridioides mangenotii]MCR1955138.1 hypothetical protein [Clostridioides mangenotii]
MNNAKAKELGSNVVDFNRNRLACISKGKEHDNSITLDLQSSKICNFYNESKVLKSLALTVEEVGSLDEKVNNTEVRINNAETRINEAEKRMRLDSKEREDRIEARQSELLSNLEKRFADMDNKIEKSNDELNKKFEKYMDKIDSKFDKMDEKIDGNNKYLRSLTITTIVGIAAMVIAVLLAVR